jgi:hypothetical protein
MALLTNLPNVSEIHSILHTQGFASPDSALSATTKSKVDLAREYFESWNNPASVLHDATELLDAGVTSEIFSDISNQLRSASSGLSSLETHINGILGADPGTPGSLGTANLVKNMGIASMEKTRQETLGLAPFNVCDSISGLFGSLIGGLNTAISAVATAIEGILGLIGDGIAAVIAAIDSVIGPALDAIAGAISEIVSTIANEIAEFAKAVAEVLKFSQTLSLPGFFKDPCFQAVIGAVAPTEMVTALELANELTS